MPATIKREWDEVVFQRRLYQPTGNSHNVGQLIEELKKAEARGYTHVWMDGTHYSIGAAKQTLQEKFFLEEPVGIIKQVLLPQPEFGSD